jgi:pyruvate dehydrogenase E1 component alpha subunit
VNWFTAEKLLWLLQRAVLPLDLVSFGVKAEQVDGNDVIRVFEKASELINLARIQGPQLIECLTYRHFEHVGPFTDAEQSRNYRSEAEVNTWIKKCPIARIEKLLVEEGKISNLEINQIKSATYEEILINWQKSCDDAYPKINSLYRNLFASS